MGLVVIIGSNSLENDEKIATIARLYAEEQKPIVEDKSKSAAFFLPPFTSAQTAEVAQQRKPSSDASMPFVFRGSSPGAADFDILVVQYSGFQMLRKMYKKYSSKKDVAGGEEVQTNLLCW